MPVRQLCHLSWNLGAPCRERGAVLTREPKSLIYIRPEVDEVDLGLRYRDTCNRTGECPGCRVRVRNEIRNGHSHINFVHEDSCPVLSSQARPVDGPLKVTAAPVRRNDPCPCGSGLKWKRCHGAAR